MVKSNLIVWDIDNIIILIVDNTSSNNTAISFIKRIIRDWNSNVLDSDFIHMRCYAHILNLIMCEGLKELDDSIIKIRNAIRHVRFSFARLASFKKCMEKLKVQSKNLVCLDFVTRWNSTYMILKVAKKFEKVFYRLEEDDGRYVAYFLKLDWKVNQKNIGPPSFLDWENVRVSIKFLKHFYHAALYFFDFFYMTSNWFFQELVSIQAPLS